MLQTEVLRRKDKYSSLSLNKELTQRKLEIKLQKAAGIIHDKGKRSKDIDAIQSQSMSLRAPKRVNPKNQMQRPDSYSIIVEPEKIGKK